MSTDCVRAGRKAFVATHHEVSETKGDLMEALGTLAGEANVVRIRGRVPAKPELRTMPSGDVLVVWRVVVRRDPADVRVRPDGKRGVSVDTLDCASWETSVRHDVVGWEPGDVVEVEGSLQRRFYRSGGQAVSRHEVVARAVRRLANSVESGSVAQ